MFNANSSTPSLFKPLWVAVALLGASGFACAQQEGPYDDTPRPEQVEKQNADELQQQKRAAMRAALRRAQQQAQEHEQEQERGSLDTAEASKVQRQLTPQERQQLRQQLRQQRN